ncbi:COX15/CtaA family protein, partial [Escherichia coli]|nr:COX15/CtaA family protein [Escherichia coli]
PRAPEVETLIEFTHRVTSGLALLLVIGLFFWARRLYGRGHIVRRSATLSLLFIITEALIGAGLVLFELVAHDRSLARALSLAAHLV